MDMPHPSADADRVAAIFGDIAERIADVLNDGEIDEISRWRLAQLHRGLNTAASGLAACDA